MLEDRVESIDARDRPGEVVDPRVKSKVRGLDPPVPPNSLRVTLAPWRFPRDDTLPVIYDVAGF